jgi:hypothetical protein
VQANRKDLVSDENRRHATNRENKRLERKKRIAEAMGEKLEAEEAGEDLERKRNWTYSIEDNERWDKKKARKERRAQFEFTGDDWFLFGFVEAEAERVYCIRLRRYGAEKVQKGRRRSQA